MEPGSLVRSRTEIFFTVSGSASSRCLADEGTVQMDLDQAHLLAGGVEVIDDFLDGLAGGAHGDDDHARHRERRSS